MNLDQARQLAALVPTSAVKRMNQIFPEFQWKVETIRITPERTTTRLSVHESRLFLAISPTSFRLVRAMSAEDARKKLDPNQNFTIEETIE